jgi:Xaa-Pro dipeptidase
MNSIFSKRIEKLKESCQASSSLVIILNPIDIYYFTGFYAEGIDRLLALIISKDGDILLVPALHKNEAANIGNVNVVTWDDSVNPWNIVKSLISNHYDTAYIEKNFPFYAYRLLFNPSQKIEYIDYSITKLRCVKDEDEIKYIKKAVEISEKSLKNTVNTISEGISEKQLANILNDNLFENGSSDLAFPTIVSFGANAANPHHIPDNTKLLKNECIVIDFGSKYKMYCSDMTRTLFFGVPDDEFLTAYKIVKNAQAKGYKNASPHMTGQSLDTTVRSIIEKSGYGRYFIHRTGHGIGLSVHEEPYVDPKNENLFVRGNTITVEPGIYIPKKFGIRIEDIVYITNDESINLNSYKHSLEIL